MAQKPHYCRCAVLRLAAVISAIALLAHQAPAQQRVLFPTQLTQPVDTSPPAIAPGTTIPTTPSWDAYADPGLAPPGTTYAGPPVYAPGPYAQPAPAPYYAPNTTTPGYLYPNGVPTYAGPPMANPMETINGFTRFFQEIRLEETYMYDTGDRKVSFNDIETSATFAIPPGWSKNPILLTPGFGLHLWDGPPSHGPGSPDLPAQTYDAFLDTAWDPQFSPYFGAELGVRVGVYTDFHTLNSDSVRIMGRGLGVINVSPTLQFKVGVIYIDRLHIKLFPAGGIFWSPDPDTRWEFFFPRPKFTHRLTTTGLYQWWYYTAAEYGGGSWTIQRDNGASDQFDYDDIEISSGIEWIPEGNPTALHGYLEVGSAVARDLYYRNGPPLHSDLRNTVFVRGGIAF